MASARTIVSYCLFPLTIWYAVGVAIRNILYAIGIKKQETPHITTIGIGNLSCGGTGKTPHAEHILHLFEEEYRVAYLSRGYRRQSKGFILCEGTPNPLLMGDEAAMIATKHPRVTVAVCEHRMEGVRKLMALPEPPQLIVMDDVFQHRRIKPTCNILLTDYHHPYFHDHILPYGNLREFRKGKERANIIVVTKTPEKLNPINRHNIMNELGTQPYQKIFFSSMTFGVPYHIYHHTPLDNSSTEHFLLFAGVAQPHSLARHLKQYGAVTTHLFPDHHDYTEAELKALCKEFDSISAANKVLITTEKDAARLQQPRWQELLQNYPIYAVPYQVVMQSSPNFDFDTILHATVKENISFLEKLRTSHLSI